MNEELAYRTIAYLIGHYKMHEETIINKDEIEAINFLLDKNEQLKDEIYKSNAVADTNRELAESYYKENQQLKEEKRLILKDISFWIRNSKVEQIEGDMVHQRYWMCFEDIINNIFKKYNTENLSDEDLKYNHYLEKENEELIREIQQLKADYGNKAQVERDLLLEEKQDLINYLKEKKKEYIELYNKSCDIIDFDRYESLNILCEEILSKIEKSDK